MTECTFVVLGATGDLSKRKLIPAIYHLIKKQHLKKFTLIGAAITNTTIETILEQAKNFIPDIDEKIWQKLSKASYFVPLDFHNADHYKNLQKKIIEAEKKHNLCGNRVFYLATLPHHFETITAHLSANKIVLKNKKTPWSRVVYEKPFGYDLRSARKINRCIRKLFDESQVYRIDHFLWEELIGNIALIRFTNILFQPLWNKDYIESVQIILNEKIGISGRGAFYDTYGALKDVVQNHMLQMLALLAMEPPKKLSGEHIRDAKAAALKKIECDDILLGQYDGYHDEKGVAPRSKTETFAALALRINNKRWKGVPFFLKTGKCLPKKETSIHIKFKKPTELQTLPQPTGGLDQSKRGLNPPTGGFNPLPSINNRLSILIQPREGFFLEINARVPGTTYELTPVKMDFCHSCIFGPNTPQAYEMLLHDVLQGDQSVFLRFDEIEHSWKLIEKILKKKHRVHTYEKGSNGPKEVAKFCKKHAMEWQT